MTFIPLTDYYVFMSNSSIDIYGYIYSVTFYPTFSYYNLLAYDDNSGENSQLKLIMSLQGNVQYALIATTFNSYTTGSYQIIASELNKLNLVLVNETSSKSNGMNTAMVSLFIFYLRTFDVEFSHQISK